MRSVFFFIILSLCFSCEKKVSVEVPVEGTTTNETLEVEVSTDIPKVNRKLRDLKKGLQKQMNAREGVINKKIPTP